MVPLLLLLAASVADGRGADGPAAEGNVALRLPRLTPNCTVSTCHGGKRASPYRLAPSDSVPIDSKSRAFADDGTYCAVVGDKYCTSTPRTVFRTTID